MYRWANPAQTAIIRESDGACIPADPANTDYAALVADKVEIAAFVAPAPAPITVTPWQARAALAGAGKLAAVEAAVEALGVSHPAYIAWHYAERIRRDSPLIAALAPALNLTDAELDALFANAATLSL